MTKTKSRHHKSENSFKFQTLSERLSNISVDVVKKINRFNTKPEETETYFYQALEKWVDLNYSASFYEFTVKVKRDCQTLALVVFNKEKLINIVKEYILIADPLSLQPILDLTVQLSRDLQNDFYQYFPTVFESIITLFDTQNTEVLEWSFQSLSYLFKFLWRYMLKDLENVYVLYSPLFGETKKEYIRNFAAESFAFLMRKVNDKNELFNFLVKRLSTNPEETYGIGRLLFEMFKGIKHQFNACTEQCFKVLLDKLYYFSTSNDEGNQVLFNCISKTVESMAEYTNKQSSGIVWKCFYDKIDAFSSEPNKLYYLMRLIEKFLVHKNCYLIDNLDSLIDHLEKIASLDFTSNTSAELEVNLTNCFMTLSVHLFLSNNVKFSIEKANILPIKLYQSKYNCNSVVDLTRKLFEYSSFEVVIIPNLINYFESNLNDKTKSKENMVYIKAFLNLMSEYLLSKKRIIEANTSLELLKAYKGDKKTLSSHITTMNGHIDHNDQANLKQFFDYLANDKSLNHLIRLFSEKKFQNGNLGTILCKHIIQDSLQIETKNVDQNLVQKITEIILISPILFQNNEELVKRINEQIKFLIKKFQNDLNNLKVDETSDDVFKNIENIAFLTSLSIWSLIMFRSSNGLLIKTIESKNENEINVKCFSNLILLLNKFEKDLKSNGNKLVYFALDKSLNHLLRAFTYYLIALNSINQTGDNLVKKLLVKEVLSVLKHQLSSPYHENRINALIILNMYYKSTEKSNSNEDETKNENVENIFEICMKAEETPASLDEYRQKLYYLQLLDPSVCAKYFSTGDDNNQDVPLRYLFGVLYENFKLIWDPVSDLVKSYSNHIKQNEFWNIFGDHIVSLSDKIEASHAKSNNDQDLDHEDADNILYHLADIYFIENLNIDYLNQRYLLCKSMQDFASSCESKTKILVPLFFKFLNNEYYLEENRLLSTAFEDITVNNKKEQKLADKKSSRKEKYLNKSILNKHLCAYLDIFSKFNSPKSWYQEEKLRDVYLNLLCHHESAVQKSALGCIYTYNHSYLTPYKEHLDKLLIGKHFRHELVVFSLDESTGIIHSDHRQNLLPILMRILYGKFHSHETTHTSNRDTKTNKRTIVIQFLSSCNETELNYFFDLIFECLKNYCDSNTKSDENSDKNLLELQAKLNNRSITDINSNDAIYNLKKVIPLKKLLGILHSLEIVIKKLARQMETFSHRILKMLCFVHKYAHSLYEMAMSHNKLEPHKIDDYYLNLFKVIRQQATLRFKQLFDTFDHLNFTQIEYFFVFDSFVWPQCVKLPSECLNSVSNLMKIFLLWSERSNYYPLFVVKLTDFDSIDSKHLNEVESLIKGNKNCVNLFDHFKHKNILDMMFELIDSPKCSQSVIDHVLEIVHNLVSFADYKQQEEADMNEEFKQAVSLTKIFSVNFIKDEFNDAKNDLNFGTMILKPYVTSIVNHIEKIVTANISKKVLPSKPLKILARLSCFATNSRQQCEKIIQLLTVYLIKNRKQTEENEINVLNSINHLIKQVDNVENFICSISRLFAIIKNRLSRVELAKIFDSIKSVDSNFEVMTKLISDLNSWDPKRLEEPDYMLRLEAFNTLNSIVKEWKSFDIKMASVLVYNCVFFLNNIEDLAIKESSTNCLKLFLQKTSTLELLKSDKNFLESNFVSEIKNGLRNKLESSRHEFINILVEFVKSFRTIFKPFNDLSVLIDDEDIEKDFYENIKHIQMHRRARALKRLQKACNDNQISAENLLGFMMPIVRSFLDNEMYHKYDYLIEDACISIGCICYVLAWPKYLKVVEYYLKILPKNIMNQKLIIKVLVNVLDAFHYDLSLSNQVDYFTESKSEMETDEIEEKESDQIQEITVNNTLMVRRKKLVGSALANKIHSTITKAILPNLFKCLTKRLKSDDQHKVNKREDEDEQILRVPMALAILKLLNNLPPRTLETHLPGLLFKVCDMLKSRAVSVRNTTRECLMKMINALPNKKYYFYVFKELSNALTRGYQVHVLCYTTQMILKNVQDKLIVGDLDSSLGILMNGINLELFSTSVSEEKEVKQILAKVSEAKTTSSFNTLEIIAKYVSQTHLMELLKPFKEQLDICNSRKLLKKIEEALRRVLLGLLGNKDLTTESLMFLIYGLINDTFTDLTNTGNKTNKRRGKPKGNDEDEKFLNGNNNDDEPYSCLLLPVEPKRGGDKPKVIAKTNQHVIVEFALQLMHNLIKQNRITNNKDQSAQPDINYTQMIDPYLSMFVEYLNGKYLKVTIITLRCLAHLLQKFQLPSLKQHSKQIATKLFNLLRTYSGASSNAGDTLSTPRGDNFELLMVCYKVISTLIKDCSTFNLDEEQLQVLMHYAERNLYDNYKQASAFNLIKAVLSRKLQCEELNEVLAKVMKLSIQADSLNVRLQSRQTILQYMLDYSLSEKKLMKILEFYIVQLDYDYENGRESSLEMLATMFNTFPISRLNENSTIFFLPLAIQLHNDESPKCKKLAWLALKSLLEKIDLEKRDSLFEITLALFNDQEKPLHKRIAALLAKLFIEVETQKFDRRLEKIIPIILSEVDANNFIKAVETNTNSLVNEKFYDQYLNNLLSLIIKLLTECKIFKIDKYSSNINQIYDQIKIYLTHEHSWVRLNSCQLFGLLFANNSVDELMNHKNSYFKHLTPNAFYKIRDLIDSFCVQLKSPILGNDLAEQVVKNLAFMAKILNKYEYIDAGSDDNLKHNVNIEWLIKKILREAKYELVNKPTETIKRTFIFKWLGALALELGKDKIKNHLSIILPTLQREIVVGEANEQLKALAHEVLEFIKQTVGVEEFSLIYSISNKKRTENKEERKRKLAQLAVVDPQLAATKKIRKMQKKKEAKKRKMTKSKFPLKNNKKIKLNNNDEDY